MVGYRAGNCLGAAEAAGTGTGHDNVGIGMFAMRKNLAGNESVVIGAGAATESTITDNVVVIGYGACGETQTLGSFTVSIGHMALIAATGDNNVAVGQQALKGTTSGSSNVAIGSGSLVTNTTGALNTAIGHNSGRLTQSGKAHHHLPTQQLLAMMQECLEVIRCSLAILPQRRMYMELCKTDLMRVIKQISEILCWGLNLSLGFVLSMVAGICVMIILMLLKRQELYQKSRTRC